MQKYSNRSQQVEDKGLRAPTRDIAIVNKDGKRTVVNRDQCVVIPYFRDKEMIIMRAGSPTEWVSEGTADGQHLYFPNSLFWDAAFTEGSIKQTLYDSGIVLKQMGDLYHGPVMQRGMEQSGRVRIHMTVLDWWDYKMTMNKSEDSKTVAINVRDFPDIEFRDIVTAYSAKWAIDIIAEYGLSHWLG